MEREYCRYEKAGHVACVTITRPHVLNALHPAASRELATVWDEVAHDDEVRLVVLTGEGNRAFCAGNDLKHMAAAAGADTAHPAIGFGGLTRRFDLFKPIIARLNGSAFGGGFELALACDVRIAADHAEMGFSEPRHGLTAGAVGVQRLLRQAPAALAMGLLLSGRRLSAEQAHRWGLVNEVVPAAQLDERSSSGLTASSPVHRPRCGSPRRWRRGSRQRRSIRWRASTFTGADASGPALT